EKCISYADMALERFFQKAERQPWFQNTLFVFTSDHTSGSGDAFYDSTLGRYCVPIAFYAPSMPELRGYDDHTIVQHIDIMPTVLGLLGYDRPYIAFGQDIFHTPAEEKFALHWLYGINCYEYIKGNRATLYDGENCLSVYDYVNDIIGQTNQMGQVPADTLATDIRFVQSFVQQYMQRMKQNDMKIKDKQL
ncbi:MAG: sulfatase-like hydrolase/transferase, partial [Bacteroidaceae bacterium]|nr:sulfatase-like hydrolase/transferase [Bacteroidaceae bacterium]